MTFPPPLSLVVVLLVLNNFGHACIHESHSGRPWFKVERSFLHLSHHWSFFALYWPRNPTTYSEKVVSHFHLKKSTTFHQRAIGFLLWKASFLHCMFVVFGYIPLDSRLVGSIMKSKTQHCPHHPSLHIHFALLTTLVDMYRKNLRVLGVPGKSDLKAQ